MTALFQDRPETVGEGRYLLQNRLGMGGVAEVFRAIDTRHDRTCAVKLMEVPRGARRQIGVRFLGEARAMSALRHPHIPEVYEAGREGGFYWFAMELAERSVAQEVKQNGPMDTEDALRIAFQTLEALAVAHQAGLVHRDVKPDNVLLASDGRALLADFGIARHPPGTVPVETRPGQLMGTPGYRAPEQEDDASTVLETADLYGVAAMLYVMVVGRKPVRLWDEHGASTIPPFLDMGVSSLIVRATHVDPGQRFADARAMALAAVEELDRVRSARNEPAVGAAWMAAFDRRLRGPEVPATGLRALLPTWVANLLGL